MNRTLLMGIVVVIALLAIVWYFMSMQTAIAPSEAQLATSTVPATSTSAPTVADTATSPAAATVKPAAAKPKTYTSLITQKGNYECLYDQSGSSGKTQNAIHISGGKLHGEFRTFSAAGTKAQDRKSVV